MSPISLDKAQVARFYAAVAPRIKQQGDEWRGPCPLHDGKRDSFSINASSGAWHCHSDCARGGSAEDFIMAKDGCGYPQAAQRLREALGIRRDDRREPKPERGRIVATYDYTDADGNLMFQVVRFEPKDFRQRRPDPANPGRWIWSVKGTDLVPYGLPRLRSATGRVYVVEGEKDADVLNARGLVATCNPQGAGKWRTEYAAHFAGLEVAVLADNDDAGRGHARTVADSLAGVAREVKVIELPDLPPKGDVYNWIQAGGTVADLEAIADAAPAIGEGAIEQPADPPVRVKHQLLTIDDLAGLPPLDWLIADRIPAGSFAVVFGPSGGGKSFITLDMALSVATGMDWDGQPVAQGPVIYATGEGVLGIKKRIDAWRIARHVSEPITQFWLDAECPALLNGGDVATFLGAIGNLPVKPALLVIDTLARAIVGGDENSAQDMGRAVDAIDHIRAQTGATVILVHHTSKARPDLERGSGALRGASDTMMLVSPDDSKQITLSCEKQKDAAPFDVTAWRLRVVEDVDSCIPERLDGVSPTKPKGKVKFLTSNDRTILDTIRDQAPLTGGPTLSDLHRLTGLAKSTIGRSLDRLRDGQYVLYDADTGQFHVGSSHPSRPVPLPNVLRPVPSHSPLGSGTGGTAGRRDDDNGDVRISIIPHEPLSHGAEDDDGEIVL